MLSTWGGFTQGCRCAPILQRPARCHSRSVLYDRSCAATGKSHKYIGTVPCCSIIRCAGSCRAIDSTEVALAENGAVQSKSSSVSIETISLGVPTFDRSARAGAILPSLVKAGSHTRDLTAPL